MTNAEHIRAMTDEELAKQFSATETDSWVYGPIGQVGWLKWLKQEVDDGET